MTIADRLAASLASLFQVDISEARSLDRTTTERWDSLMHIEVLFLLEEEFDFVPSPDLVPQLTSFAALLAALEQAGVQ